MPYRDACRDCEIIHTGLQHSVIRNDQPNCLPLDEVTLAEKLKEVGYATHLVGKWHLGFYTPSCLPTRRGFDSFFGYLIGQEDYYKHIHDGGYDLKRHETDVSKQYQGDYTTHVFTSEAQNIIKSHDPSTPLFLYMSYQSVHANYLQVPEHYSNMYNGVIDDEDRRIVAGMVTCMDEGIGNITQTLKETELWNNTIIIFSSDNGGDPNDGGNNWPLRGEKGTHWEGAIHGLGFVYSSDIAKDVRGTVNTEMIHVSDWFPTIVNLAGGSLNGTKPLDGFDQWQTISQGAESPRTEILINIDPLVPPPSDMEHFFHGWNGTYNTSMCGAIRVGDWKLITGYPGEGSWTPPPESGHQPIIPNDKPGKHVWLFNIAEDPTETTDLSEDNLDKVIELLIKMDEYLLTSVPVVYPPNDPLADPSLNDGIWRPWSPEPYTYPGNPNNPNNPNIKDNVF
uniref:Arylsulfatase B-like n=1 Tax=Saccoglossus kowalevskii TaxID=10224 RepID=A0ABM0LTX3_SACKO|nr:PREDICTED: arylsulfatase B-like [Saccoglossus kowalevskii]